MQLPFCQRFGNRKTLVDGPPSHVAFMDDLVLGPSWSDWWLRALDRRARTHRVGQFAAAASLQEWTVGIFRKCPNAFSVRHDRPRAGATWPDLKPLGGFFKRTVLRFFQRMVLTAGPAQFSCKAQFTGVALGRTQSSQRDHQSLNRSHGIGSKFSLSIWLGGQQSLLEDSRKPCLCWLKLDGRRGSLSFDMDRWTGQATGRIPSAERDLARKKKWACQLVYFLAWNLTLELRSSFREEVKTSEHYVILDMFFLSIGVMRGIECGIRRVYIEEEFTGEYGWLAGDAYQFGIIKGKHFLCA